MEIGLRFRMVGFLSVLAGGAEQRDLLDRCLFCNSSSSEELGSSKLELKLLGGEGAKRTLNDRLEATILGEITPHLSV